MKIVTAAEMRDIDRATSERFGVPSLTLMENAGSAVAEFVLATYPSAVRIGVLCGKGNNGGDGFVVARKLRDAGKEVALLLLCDPMELSGVAAEMFKKVGTKPIVVRTSEDLQTPGAQDVFRSDVLVDAILGTGFRPPVSALYGESIAAMNASSKQVVAVDIPSGAEADAKNEQTGIVAKADAIVTFTAPRLAHVFTPLTKGPTLCASIGSPEAAIVSSLNLHVTTAHDFAEMLASRPADSNKGSYGHVLVVGGSLGKAGAPAMAGFSALRTGAGLSTVATPKSIVSTVASFHPEVMTEPLDETGAGTIAMQALESTKFAEMLKGKTVLAVGPGISRQAETVRFVRALVAQCTLPVVLDADGLNAFEGHTGELSGAGRPVVITPHPGEMARLAGCSIREVQQNRLKTARDFAREHGLIVVLKGNRTIVAAPDGTAWVNTTGNPGMATGGTGDVLTGIVAGSIAQHPQRILDATVMAVFLHGLAGDIGRDTVEEESLVATDLIRFLPNAFRRARQSFAGKMVRIGC
jgi:ADP-dependent NAD(P)H-hydrate dehydratase / NAD(P)H-hydrate epimerase